MVTDKYEKMLKRFELHYPHFYSEAVDWWASGRISIAIKLSDGTILDYNDVDNTIRWVKYDDNSDEESRRNAFGCNLQKYVMYCGMSKGDVAEKLGISKTMLSRYLHGKTMPSLDKGLQIANLMKCTVEELFDETYMEE